MNEIDPRWIRLVEYVKEKRGRLQAAIDNHEVDPHGLRNLIAEMGVELTPQELTNLVSVIRTVIENIDAEEFNEE
jgi:hypothetical protein|tara:strand:+ start:480 stop:704 length:225 start_codon:yes stop_codon:yes gene_type:complete